VIGAVGNDRADAAPGAAICYDSSSPTASMDRDFASAAERAMHAHLPVVGYDGSLGVSERYFRTLARTQCALILGFPVDQESPDPPDGLAVTQPYLRTGYVLASLGRPRMLASLRPGETVAVVTATAPDFYLVGAFGKDPHLAPDVFQTPDEAIAALLSHEAAVAMLWAPSVVRYNARHGAHIRMSALPLHHAAFAMAALYDPESKPLADRFDRAIVALRRTGDLQRLTQPYTVESH
jgi:hypothetical protein